MLSVSSRSLRPAASSWASLPQLRPQHTTSSGSLLTSPSTSPGLAGRSWQPVRTKMAASASWRARRAEIKIARNAKREARMPQGPLEPVLVEHDPADFKPRSERTYPKMGVNPKLQFAIIRTMGRQYKVLPGDLLMVDSLDRRVDINQNVVFDRVLLLGSRDFTVIGRPTVDGALVHGTVEEHTQLKRILVFKKRRRKGYQKMQGFAARATLIRINDVWGGEKSGAPTPDWVTSLGEDPGRPIGDQVLRLSSRGLLPADQVSARQINWASEFDPAPEGHEEDTEVEYDDAEGSGADEAPEGLEMEAGSRA